MDYSKEIGPEIQDLKQTTIADVLTSQKLAFSDFIIEASLFDNKRDNIPKSFKGSLKELIGTYHEVRPNKDGLAFSPAIFRDGATRSSEGVIHLSFLAYDVDHVSNKQLGERRRALGSCAYIVYNTFSDQLDGPNDRRFRLIIPVNRPFTKSEHRLVYPFIGTLIGGYDQAASDPSRMFFKPSASVDRIALSKLLYRDGLFVDIDKAISFAPALESQVSLHASLKNSSGHRGLLAEIRLSSLFKNCETADRLARAGKLRQLRHEEGFTLLSWVSCFENGVNRFIAKMIGWGKTPDQLKQIEHFVEKRRYAPYSCARAQNLGVCKKNNPEACLEARSYNGKKVSPSPIRFGFQSLHIQDHITSVMKKYGLYHE